MSENRLQSVIDGQAGLNEFLGLGAKQVRAITAIGANLYEQGKLEESRRIFKGLVALDPSNYMGYAGLGALALIDERLEEAYGFQTKAAALQGRDPAVHANLGETLLRQARFTESAAEFQKALDLDPQRKNSAANRARAIIDSLHIVIAEAQKIAS